MKTQIRHSFSPAVADRIRAGASVSQALHDVLGNMTPTRTLDVLADLEAMGVWKPRPIRKRKEP